MTGPQNPPPQYCTCHEPSPSVQALMLPPFRALTHCPPHTPLPSLSRTPRPSSRYYPEREREEVCVCERERGRERESERERERGVSHLNKCTTRASRSLGVSPPVTYKCLTLQVTYAYASPVHHITYTYASRAHHIHNPHCLSHTHTSPGMT